MGDLEYTPHPDPTLLLEEEEDNTNTRETQEVALRVPTSRDSESPITTPLVGISELSSFLPVSTISICPTGVNQSLFTERGEEQDTVMVLLQYVPGVQGEEEGI